MNPLVARILTKIDALLSKQAHGEEQAAPPSDQAARLQGIKEAMADMRQLLQRTGAGFGAAAAAVLTGLGYAQLHQLFPIPPTNRGWIAAAALIGVISAFGGAVFLAGRFFSAQRRIRVTPREGGSDFNREDAAIQSGIYKETALEERAPTLEALELRARRLERIARQTQDKDTPTALESEAARVTDVYRWAMHFSAASILERRSRDAFRGSRPFALITAAGIILAFGAADYAKGQRDKIGLLKDCQAAITAGAPGACDPVRGAKARAAQEAKDAAGAKAISAALDAARTTFKNAKAGARLDRLEACARILLATPGLKGAGDQASASVVNACLKLVTNS